MDTDESQGQTQELEIPERVARETGEGGLPKARLTSEVSQAEVYLHGAHVTHFQKNGERPVLFMSRASEYASDRPIRGGIPVIFPWFGPREGRAAHGFARVTEWDWLDSSVSDDGAVSAVFRFPKEGQSDEPSRYSIVYRVTIDARLTLELEVTNHDPERLLEFELCLHSYFAVGGIEGVEIAGLRDSAYIDKMAGGAEKFEKEDVIRIGEEVDRVYFDAPQPVEIRDTKWGRRIRIDKQGSDSTVVWNPWIEKSKRMPDFGDDEHPHMVCVESGNVGPNRVTLKPGDSSAMAVSIGTSPL